MTRIFRFVRENNVTELASPKSVIMEIAPKINFNYVETITVELFDSVRFINLLMASLKITSKSWHILAEAYLFV